MDFTLSFTPSNLGDGLFVMVVGMVIVFIALVALIYLFKLMSAVVLGFENRGGRDAEPEHVPAAEAPAAVEVIEDDGGDVAAAIAAVMCMLDEERRGAVAAGGLTVRSLRRVTPRAPIWKD